jgi:hypothetical protein
VRSVERSGAPLALPFITAGFEKQGKSREPGVIWIDMDKEER